jgi:hypothetical protein
MFERVPSSSYCRRGKRILALRVCARNGHSHMPEDWILKFGLDINQDLPG